MSRGIATADKRLIVNGEARRLAVGGVADLLERLGLGERRQGIAVAINGEVVRRADWSRRALEDGDEVEIVAAVQGG